MTGLRIFNIIITIVGLILSFVAVYTDNILSAQLTDPGSRLIATLIFILITLQLTFVLQQVELIVSINKSSNLEKRLRTLGSDREFLEDLIRSTVEVKQSANPIILDRKRVLLQEYVRKMGELSKGKFETYFWNCNILATAVQNMQHELIGLSPWSRTDADWWSIGDGKAFFEINKRAVERNKSITRIFVYKDGEMDSLKAEMRRHVNIGVRVYYVSESDLIRAGFKPLDAMAVVDNRLAFWGETNDKLRHPDRNFFSVDPEEIKQTNDLMRRIIFLANEEPREIDSVPYPEVTPN